MDVESGCPSKMSSLGSTQFMKIVMSMPSGRARRACTALLARVVVPEEWTLMHAIMIPTLGGTSVRGCGVGNVVCTMWSVKNSKGVVMAIGWSTPES